MEEDRKVHKGLLGYKVFIKKWSDEASAEVLAGLLVDLVGYTVEEATILLGKEPVLIVDNATPGGALNLAAALEIYGCITDVYYRNEHILFEDEMPQIFDENGALCESVVRSFQLISNKNRVDVMTAGGNNHVENGSMDNTGFSSDNVGNNAADDNTDNIGVETDGIVTDDTAASMTTFSSYKLADENIIRNVVRRPVEHRVLEDHPIGYMPAVPLDRPGRGRRGCRGRSGRRTEQ